MAKFAEEECATCHAIRPKNEMREVKVERVIGRSYGGSNTARSGRRQYNSFSSSGRIRFGSGTSSSSGHSSRSNTRTRVERVWVCLGCRAPRSDGWFGSLVSKIAIAGALGWWAISSFTHQKGTEARTSQTEASDAGEQTGAAVVEPVETEASTTVTNAQSDSKAAQLAAPSEPVVIFAPPHEVVQRIPNASEVDEVACSGNCTGN